MRVERFGGLHPDAFIHPEDRATLQALRSVPGLDALIKAITGSTIEEQMHAERSQTCIRLGRAQYRSLYAMVERAANTLDVPMPDVYLDTGYQVNAWAFGFNRYTITLYSGLVDLFDEGEIQTVIGHEIGHIKCEHMLYKSTAYILTNVGNAVLGKFLGPFASLVTGAIELALLRWSRAAEYSCDRAGLLVVQDPEIAASALARLGGTSRRYREEFSLEHALLQAEEMAARKGSVGRVLDALRQIGTTHPDTVLRAKAIGDWASSAEYMRILGGDYPTRARHHADAGGTIEGVATCALCAAPLGDAPACARCGLNVAPREQRRCIGGHPNNRAWKFCKSCGKGLD